MLRFGLYHFVLRGAECKPYRATAVLNSSLCNTTSKHRPQKSSVMRASAFLYISLVALVAVGCLVRAQQVSWKDSYSINGRCYCDTTYDHDIADVIVDTAIGQITVREACEKVGSGPQGDRKYYNDVQCGNGPANNAGDEQSCPGRVDMGNGNSAGCNIKGPKWQFDEAPIVEEPDPGDPPTHTHSISK